MALGQNIAAYRKLRNMTQAELANKLSVSQSMIARWENGKVKPNSESLARLADALAISVEQLRAKNILGGHDLDDEDDDPELSELFGQAHRLDTRDREALKAILEAMLTQARVRDALQRKGA